MLSLLEYSIGRCIFPPMHAGTRIAQDNLPPHLHELCEILAAGVVWHRSCTAEEVADAAALSPDCGESSLHFTAHQSGHANPKARRVA